MTDGENEGDDCDDVICVGCCLLYTSDAADE